MSESDNLADGRYALRDLVDIDRLQGMLERFSQATGFTAGLVAHPTGELLVRTGWRDVYPKLRQIFLATEVYRAQRNLELPAKLKELQALSIRAQERGIADSATPIIVGGARLAELYVGRIVFEEPDIDEFRKPGEPYSYDVDAYLRALRAAPVVTEADLESALAFLSETVAMLAERGLAELRNRRLLADVRGTVDRYRGMVESLGDWLWETDAQGVLRYAGPRVEALLGYPPEQIIGKSLFNLMPPAEGERAAAAFRGLVRTGRPIATLESTYLHKDGRRRIVTETWGMPVFDTAGAVTGCRGIDRDITERKQAEQRLRETKERYRRLSEAAFEAILVHDNGVLVSANEQFFEMFGRTPQELAGKILPPIIVAPEAMAVTQAQIAADALGPYESVGLRRNGDRFPVEIRTRLMEHEGRTVRIATIMDITDRKRAEEELNHLQNYLSSIIDSMPSVLVGVDLDGKVTQWNVEAQRATGLWPDEALGQPLGDVFPRLAGEMEWVCEAMWAREVRSESRQAHRDGDESRYEDVTVYPLIGDGVAGAVVRVDDVTERVRIEEMMVQSEKMLSVGGLAAGMAHEINNPLGGMMQTASVMRDRLTDPDMKANVRAAKRAGITMEAIGAYMEARGILRMLDGIRDSGTRAAEIVRNILSFARRSYSSSSSCNLAELLDQCVDLAGSDYDLHKHYDVRQIEIVREYEEDLPPVPCESGKIQQVLLNVLRNGAEAMQEAMAGGRGKQPRFVLRLAHEKESGMIRLEIEDNGPGMDEATRKRVFEPFFTTKPTDRGTGLGLSVSYFIVTENHGGKMSVESTPGAGAKFIITLPVARPNRGIV